MISNIFSELIYILVYFVSIVFFVLAEKSNRKNNEKLLILIGVFVVAVFAGLRAFSVGTDTYSTLRMYNVVVSWGTVFSSIFNTRYFLYYFLSKVFSLFGASRHFFLFFMSLLTVGPVAICAYKLKEKVKIWFTMALYLFMYFQMGLNLIRESAALSVLFLAVFMFKDKMFFKGILLGIFAFYLHTSVLIGILLYLFAYVVLKIKIPVVKLLSVFVVGILVAVISSHWTDIILFIMKSSRLSARYLGYLNVFLEDQSSHTAWFGVGTKVYIDYVLRVLILLIPTLLYSKSLRKKDDLFLYFRISAFIAFIIYSGVLFVFDSTYGLRISMILEISNVICLGIAAQTRSGNFGLRRISYKPLITFILVFFYSIWWYLVRGSHQTLPYILWS